MRRRVDGVKTMIYALPSDLHLERQLEDALDLLGAQGADLGDMAQGGGHFVAAVDPYGEFLQRPAQMGCAILL